MARVLMDAGNLSVDEAIANPAIPIDLRESVRAALLQEQVLIITEPTVITGRTRGHHEWLYEVDRNGWYYWPRLRNFLIDTKGWPSVRVRSLDDATDRILEQLEPPKTERFNIRGLVLGYVQSGKTANYSALIAKAVDVGYRLVIVLSGIHNALRQQTQRRLSAELVGYVDGRPDSIPLPEPGKRWFGFTTDELNGDFDAGHANFASLQGTQPVLVVTKKNGKVLERLAEWLDSAPDDVRSDLPVLIIDDEADQASINTGGNRPGEDEEEDDADLADSAPSVINERIRTLIGKFHRAAYIAYTATPFANMLIRHNAVDSQAGLDLYPKDFIIDLPKPPGYFGPEEIFGRPDADSDREREGLDVVREIPDDEIDAVRPPRGLPAEYFQPSVPPSLSTAILDFVLAGAARRQRGDGDEPATMLIHTSERTIIQERLTELIQGEVFQLRDEWRYQRELGIRDRLESRWIAEFRPLIRSLHNERDVPFDALIDHVGPFLEALAIMLINSRTEDELDYERDPDLKVIVVGGNRLSRGLTLEGLLVSYFIRRSTTFDTLMQMGRWFGFREGYEDLTRIYTTAELDSWFSDLARVEYQLRTDIQVYEREGVTPIELGPRILKHPSMLVTSRVKMRDSSEITVEQSYAAHLLQTTVFPFDQRQLLAGNIDATRRLVSSLGPPEAKDLLWRDVPWRAVLAFLEDYYVDPEERTISLELIRQYITRQVEQGELVNWVVSIRARQAPAEYLGSMDLGLSTGVLANAIERTRLRSRNNSLGVITSPGDEELGLSREQLDYAEELQAKGAKRGDALRKARPKTEGLLLIYPISRHSGHSQQASLRTRQPIFAHPERGEDIIGVALSFPDSDTALSVSGTYIVGSLGWRAL